MSRITACTVWPKLNTVLGCGGRSVLSNMLLAVTLPSTPHASIAIRNRSDTLRMLTGMMTPLCNVSVWLTGQHGKNIHFRQNMQRRPLLGKMLNQLGFDHFKSAPLLLVELLLKLVCIYPPKLTHFSFSGSPETRWATTPPELSYAAMSSSSIELAHLQPIPAANIVIFRVDAVI